MRINPKLTQELQETLEDILRENPSLEYEIISLLEDAIEYPAIGIITVSKKVLRYLFEKYNMAWVDKGTGEASFIYDDCEGIIGIITGSGDYERCQLVLSTNQDDSVETALWKQLTKYPSSVMCKMGLIRLFENNDFNEVALAHASVIIYG